MTSIFYDQDHVNIDIIHNNSFAVVSFVASIVKMKNVAVQHKLKQHAPSFYLLYPNRLKLKYNCSTPLSKTQRNPCRGLAFHSRFTILNAMSS